MFECSRWSEWRVERDIDGDLCTWQSWEDLDRGEWVDEGSDSKEEVDRVREFLFHVDLRLEN